MSVLQEKLRLLPEFMEGARKSGTPVFRSHKMTTSVMMRAGEKGVIMYRFREGFYSDVRIEERFTTSIRHRDGILEENRSTSVKKAFVARMRDLIEGVLAIPGCQGYCYTQFTDVMQEKNGLLTEDRTPKVPLEKIRALNGICRKEEK